MKFIVTFLCVLPLISGFPNSPPNTPISNATVSTVNTTLATTAASTAASTEPPTTTTPAPPSELECISNYLKSKGFLGNKNQTIELNPNCTVVVKLARDEAANAYRKKFLANEQTKNNADCLVEKLEKTDTYDRELISRLDFSASNASDNVKANSESLGILKNMMNVIKAISSCDVESSFDENFKTGVEQTYEKLFNSTNSKADTQDDYCIRLHLMDKNLISFKPTAYRANPKNLKVFRIDCVQRMEKYFTNFEKSLIEQHGDDTISHQDYLKWQNCFSKIIHKNNYIDQLLQFDYVTEFELNNENKEELRKIFVDIVTKVAKTAKKCAVPEGFAAL